jgi:hypothetical protein
MAKKRPTLDTFLNSQTTESVKDEGAPKDNLRSAVSSYEKREVIRHMLYLPLPVYDQLQDMILEEQRGQTKRRKMHDYLLDAIDLLFKEKGLKSISELTSKE